MTRSVGGLGIDRPLRVRFSAGAGTLSPADARSALFSWLIARRSGGHFVVRLDDAQPLGEQASDAVTDLRWLGLEPDEGPDAGNAFGPYRSAERRALYDAALAELAARGATHERDGAMVLQRGVAATVVPDLLHGDVHFGGEALGEIVVRGADGVPSRVLRATVDDAAMRIDLVVQDGRGLDRAARQTALARALGVSSPRFAHAGTLVEPKDATLPAVGDLRRAGYLPGAVIEHLALLGWSPADGRETFTLEELAELFSLDRVGVSETHFDPDRLRAFNGRALRLLPRERYHALLAERMQRTRLLEDPIPAAAHRWIETFLDAFGAEAHTLGEAIDAVAALRAESTAIPALELERLRNRHVLFFLDTVSQYVDDQPELRDLPLGHDLPAIAAEFGLAREDAFAAVRMALTGTHDGPPLSLLFPLLGHERIMMRIGAVSSHILHGRGLDPIKFGPGGVPFETIRPELPQATANRGDGS